MKTTTKSNVTSITAVTKIERARAEYTRVTDTSFVIPEGSSPRAEFIAHCVTVLEMTENGASTYWQNLQTEAKGGLLYKHAKPATGAPRGRRPDANRELKKAAARVQQLTARVNKNTEDLAEATAQFTELMSVNSQ